MKNATEYINRRILTIKTQIQAFEVDIENQKTFLEDLRIQLKEHEDELTKIKKINPIP